MSDAPVNLDDQALFSATKSSGGNIAGKVIGGLLLLIVGGIAAGGFFLDTPKQGILNVREDPIAQSGGVQTPAGGIFNEQYDPLEATAPPPAAINEKKAPVGEGGAPSESTADEYARALAAARTGSGDLPPQRTEGVVVEAITTPPANALPQQADPVKNARQQFRNEFFSKVKTQENITGGASLDQINGVTIYSAPAQQQPADSNQALLDALAQPQAPILPENTAPSVLEYNQQNDQPGKIQFLEATPQGGIYNSSPPHQALSPYIIRAGTFIPIMLEGSANSDLPGHLSARVLDDIYDSVNNLVLLVPRGSQVLLRYNSNVRFNQERIQISADRILLPNYSSILLDGVQLHDSYGAVGLGKPDIEVDNHYDDVLGAATASGLLGYATSLAGDGSASDDVIEDVASALGLAANNVGEEIIDRTLNRQPTLTAKPGSQGILILTRDLILPPYNS